MGLFGKGRSSKKEQGLVEIVTNLRMTALTLSPSDISVLPPAKLPHVRYVMMEMGHPGATVSLLSAADGTTSMYFSNGKAIIGCGDHDTVRQASFRLLETAERHLDALDLTSDFSFPSIGRVRFFVLTLDGLLAGDYDDKDLEARKDEISELFYAGHGVIAEIRQLNLA